MAARRARGPVAVPPARRQSSPHEEPYGPLAQRSLCALILCAERIAATITENTELTLARPDVVAKALAALGETINTAADGLARLAALHADEPACDDPLRGSLEAYGKELEKG
jgi:hypothetical protein